MGRVAKCSVDTRDSSIRMRFTFEGKRHQPTLMLNNEPMKPTAPNMRYAHRLAVEITEKIRHGTFSMAETFPQLGSGGSLTVAVQLESWLAVQALEPSTLRGYRAAVNFWTLWLGDKLVRHLKHSEILKALSNRPDLNGKTVNNYLSVLREAMQMAVLDKVITANPVADIPKAKWQKPEADPFTDDEADSIIAAMAAQHPEQIYNLVEWWLNTGVRTSEMAGLKWAQVDVAGGTMTIQEALVRGEAKDNTKTNVSRVVKLNARALAAIKRQQAHTRLAGGFVWLDPRYDQPWSDERAFRRSYWTPVLRDLEIRYRRPYNMRHTRATQMLMKKMNPAFCARQLGHSVEVFFSTYARWVAGEQDDAEMAKEDVSTTTEGTGT